MTAAFRSVATTLVACIGLIACGASDPAADIEQAAAVQYDGRLVLAVHPELVPASSRRRHAAVVEPLSNFVLERKPPSAARVGN